MAKTTYLVNGEVELSTVKEVSEELGRKVTKKDIIEGLVPEVEVVEATDLDEELVDDIEEEVIEEEVEDYDDYDENDVPDTEEEVEDYDEDMEEFKDMEVDEDSIEDTEEEVEEPSETTPSMDNLLKKLKKNNEKIAKNTPEKSKKKATVALELDSEGNVVYPERGYFKDEATLKKYYKQLSNDQLDEWIALESLEYNPNDNEGIDRMRKCMAIMNFHFPKESKPKKKSPYSDYTTEQLIELALDNNIEVQDAKGDLRILRMYAIVALRKAGILG